VKEKRIKCARWDSLRQRMKGTSTQTKLGLLEVYLKNAWMEEDRGGPHLCCDNVERTRRVYLYLLELHRGGYVTEPRPDSAMLLVGVLK